ncbi:probable serine/threonine-protein kinase dyrk1 [Tenebrio molitor]|uniref:probable serine/threonine-protein kinase dyrk1 n=1 Tax=Tenebrio molitor TaxID=7067 RepID=UPI00362494F3
MFLLLHLFLVLMITNAHYLYPPKTGLFLRQKRATTTGSCTAETIKCPKPLDDSQTKLFKCDNDEGCPDYYKCCEDSCFQHRICKLSQNSKNLEECPAENFLCHRPLHYEQTSKFSCYSSDQCPQGYACCEDSCFWHKICKEGIFTTPRSDAVVLEEKSDNNDVNKGGTDLNLDSTESSVNEAFEDVDNNDEENTTSKQNNFENGDDKSDDDNIPHNNTSTETSDGANEDNNVTDVDDVEETTGATDNVNNASETVNDNSGDSNTESNGGATDDNYEDNFNDRSKNGTDNGNRDDDSEEKESEDEEDEDENGADSGGRLGGLFGL